MDEEIERPCCTLHSRAVIFFIAKEESIRVNWDLPHKKTAVDVEAPQLSNHLLRKIGISLTVQIFKPQVQLCFIISPGIKNY